MSNHTPAILSPPQLDAMRRGDTTQPLPASAAGEGGKSK